jgi:hypothetical protein
LRVLPAMPGHAPRPQPGPYHRTVAARGRSRDRLGRIVGLDVARALAVFGMLGAHVGVVAPDVGRPRPPTERHRPMALLAREDLMALLAGKTS